mmetsp:Transcript_73238/g.212098  ORF Transcript_73238/g.212098 Transcript_73238/m.212098 type:complete len:326 (+) Transcript_73238:109-1086(+)
MAAARLVFCDSERGLPVLRRGWRTPDPSPTRGSEGLPRCGPKLCDIVAEEDEEEGEVMTPRRRCLEFFVAAARRGAKRDAARTPSPVPAGALPVATSGMWYLQAAADVSGSSTPLRSFDGGSSADEEQGSPMFLPMSAPWRAEDGQVGIDGEVKVALSSKGATDAAIGDSYAFLLLCKPQQSPGSGKGVPHGGNTLADWDVNANVAEDAASVAMGRPLGANHLDAWAIKVSPDGSEGLDDAQFCIPSIGSAGHPHKCAEFCKYAKKAKGCKDGAACNRCHLCTKKRPELTPPPPQPPLATGSRRRQQAWAHGRSGADATLGRRRE